MKNLGCFNRAAFTLAEGATHVVHFNDIRRVAFTLAEVLITLGSKSTYYLILRYQIQQLAQQDSME